MTRPVKNIAASVQTRLLQLSQKTGDDYLSVLSRYALERVLYRIGLSAHRRQFVLKGAMLFAAWSDTPHRATRDLDLLGFGPADVESLEQHLRDICAVKAADDGITFDMNTLRGVPIREDLEYGGVRLTMLARLQTARIPIQIDVGFGDVVTPRPSVIDFPVLLDAPKPHVRAYTRESVVAEKLHAMVTRGIGNSRMKDFFDVARLCEEFAFDGSVLAAAIAATFGRRTTPVPREAPVALTAEFYEDNAKQRQWIAFAKRIRAPATSLKATSAKVSNFVSPVLRALADDVKFRLHWPKGGPWR